MPITLIRLHPPAPVPLFPAAPTLRPWWQQQRVQDEMATYVGQRPGPAFRELYLERVQEQENRGKHLREKQKIVKASHEPNMRQLDMWRDLKKIMDSKAAYLEAGPEGSKSAAPTNAGFETDRLVL